MSSLLILFLISAFSLCSLATDFYITSPFDTISWKAGKPATITWNIIPGGPDVSSVNVDLMDGDDNNAHVLQPIASGLPPGSRSVEWMVPDNFPSTSTVFVRVSGQGKSSVHRFSHRFAIQGSAEQAQNPQKPATNKDGPQPTVSAQAKQSAVETLTTTESSSSSQSEPSRPTETEPVPSVSVQSIFRKNDASAPLLSALVAGISIALSVYMLCI